jgi:hypothetical protein
MMYVRSIAMDRALPEVRAALRDTEEVKAVAVAANAAKRAVTFIMIAFNFNQR